MIQSCSIFIHFSQVAFYIPSIISLILSRLITLKFIYCLLASAFITVIIFSAGFSWGVKGGIVIHLIPPILVNFLNSRLRWSDELLNIKQDFLSQLLNYRIDSFTSFMNNQNDFELIEPIEANSPSNFQLEIATIKTSSIWSSFITKVDDTPLLLQLYRDILFEIHMKIV